MKLIAPPATCPDIPPERSYKDGSGQDRLLQQILKQGVGDQPLHLFGCCPQTAGEGAVWPWAMAWFCYGEEIVL